jgi:hypothetical protein
MIKIVFDANLPMKIGAALLGVAILIFIVYAVAFRDVFAVRYAAICVAIAGFMIYAIGRIRMLWQRRY